MSWKTLSLKIILFIDRHLLSIILASGVDCTGANDVGSDVTDSVVLIDFVLDEVLGVVDSTIVDGSTFGAGVVGGITSEMERKFI